jgi:hypothetical protein
MDLLTPFHFEIPLRFRYEGFMKSARTLLLFVGLALFSVSFSAHAEDGDHHPKRSADMATVKQDCAADVEKFCKVPPPPKSEGAPPPPPHGCLHEHLAKLGPKCKAHVEAMESKHPHPPRGASKPPVGDEPPPPPPGEAPPPPPAEGSPSTSIEQESSDLAAALLKARAYAIGEPLSPAERTITLASAATAVPKKSVAVEMKDETSPSLAQPIFGFGEEIQADDPETRAAIKKARRESGVETAPSPSKVSDGSTESL